MLRYGTIICLTALLALGATALDDGPPAIETLPSSRGGQELVGRKLAKLEFDRWPRAIPDEERDSSPRATLYRWWTDSCPYCEASLPAIEKLREKYTAKGLRTVAVYHPKPPRVVRDEAIVRAADGRGYSGPVALDRAWSVLRKAYFAVTDGPATSVTIVVDRDGIVRFVHPGPVYFPSDEARNVRENRDFELLEKAIASLVGGADE